MLSTHSILLLYLERTGSSRSMLSKRNRWQYRVQYEEFGLDAYLHLLWNRQ